MEGGRGGEGEKGAPRPSASRSGEASLSTVYSRSLRQAGTSPKLEKGKEFGHPPNNLVLKHKTTDGNREIWGSTNSQ